MRGPEETGTQGEASRPSGPTKIVRPNFEKGIGWRCPRKVREFLIRVGVSQSGGGASIRTDTSKQNCTIHSSKSRKQIGDENESKRAFLEPLVRRAPFGGGGNMCPRGGGIGWRRLMRLGIPSNEVRWRQR